VCISGLDPHRLDAAGEEGGSFDVSGFGDHADEHSEVDHHVRGLADVVGERHGVLRGSDTAAELMAGIDEDEARQGDCFA
jgi:hypothetical protein